MALPKIYLYIIDDASKQWCLGLLIDDLLFASDESHIDIGRYQTMKPGYTSPGGLCIDNITNTDVSAYLR